MAQITITAEDLPAFAQGKQVKLLKFAGQLDESNVDDKAKEIYEIINGATENLFLIFDFGDLEYMNSKSIGYLTDWYTKLSEKKGGIMIVRAKPNILDILQVVGLTQLITTYSTLEEAKLSISK